MGYTSSKIREARFRYRGEEVSVGFLASQPKGEATERVLGLPFYQIYPYLDKLNAETGKKFNLIHPRSADKLLSQDWVAAHLVMGDLPFATDGIIAYGKPGEKLGAEIVFHECGRPRLILPTGKYQGEKDVAITAMGLSSADFMEQGRDIVLRIAEERLIAAEDFPAEDGRYKKHNALVPYGRPCERTGHDTFFLRRAKGCYVGNLARHAEKCGDYFPVNYMPWDELGVFVTLPDDIFSLIATCSAPRALDGLIEEARKELRGISGTLRPEKTAALRRLVILALEVEE